MTGQGTLCHHPEGTESPDLSIIKLLGTMCFDRNKTLAAQADKALYHKIIIPLCDDFTNQSTHLANLILATLIQQNAERRDLESRQILDQAGLKTEAQLLARIHRIQDNVVISTEYKQHIKKICILSRVTIGADISITSIIIQRLLHHFPEIPITIIGPDHVPQLFNWPFLNHISFQYNRHHAHYSRLGSWMKLYHLITKERRNLRDEEFLLVDPDTRISQLGLLPLAPEQSTRILPSRIDQTEPCSLPTITNRWLDSVLQQANHVHPTLEIQEHAKSTKNKTFTIVINFGAGNDPRKRVSLHFEQELALALLSLSNTKLILDSGKGQEEILQAKGIEDFIVKHNSTKNSANSFTRVQNSISELTNHIKMADLFIGYDSCSGHIATCYNTPTIICFKGAPNPRFYARWQPANRFNVTSCLEVQQKQLSPKERSLLIQRIIDIASSHHHVFSSKQ